MSDEEEFEWRIKELLSRDGRQLYQHEATRVLEIDGLSIETRKMIGGPVLFSIGVRETLFVSDSEGSVLNREWFDSRPVGFSCIPEKIRHYLPMLRRRMVLEDMADV
jgi:hypothetical protein